MTLRIGGAKLAPPILLPALTSTKKLLMVESTIVLIGCQIGYVQFVTFMIPVSLDSLQNKFVSE
jgi:hypothetical protein